MKGKNPKRPPETGDGLSLSVVEIFATLQGEGMHAGVPAIFIRLGGCNLACSFCDTQFEKFSTQPISDIVTKAQMLAKGHHLAVITGGEPLRQNITPLCEALLEAGFAVQIETNGTIYRNVPDSVDVVCSPKAVDGSYYPLRPDMLSRVNALKFLISTRDAVYGDVPQIGQVSRPDLAIFIQPMDEEDALINAANMARCVALCQQHGYRLSLQTHKILGIA